MSKFAWSEHHASESPQLYQQNAKQWWWLLCSLEETSSLHIFVPSIPKGTQPSTQVSKATTPSQEEEKPSGCPFQTDLPTYPGIGFSSPFHQNQGAAVPWKSKGQIAAADTPNPTSTIHHTLSLRLLGRLLQPRVAPGSAVFNPWPLPNQLGERINHC